MIEQHRTDHTVRITLHPNRSASWHETKRFLWLLAVPIVIIAIGWTFVGAWLVLPFAGIEFGLCVFLFYRVCHASYHQQRLELDPQQIRISEGYRHWHETQIARRGALLNVLETEQHWRLPRLQLVNDNATVNVGHFLNLEDRQALIEILSREGIIVCRNHWWKR